MYKNKLKFMYKINQVEHKGLSFNFELFIITKTMFDSFKN